MSIPDMYDQWLAHERQQEMQRERLPKCDRCHDEIPEYFFDIYGDIYCEDCARKLFRREVALDE
jgi:hypothetical protein